MEEARQGDPAHGVDAVHNHAQVLRGDPLRINKVERQDLVDVLGKGVAGAVPAEGGVGCRGGLSGLGAFNDGLPLRRRQELARLVEQLEGVPLFRVVRGTHHDAPGGLLLQHGHLNGGRRGHPEVHHVAPHPAQRPNDDLGAGVSGWAGVAPHDDTGWAVRGIGPFTAPRAEGPGIPHQDGGIQALPDDATDAGDGRNQGVVRSHGAGRMWKQS
jgi:hypothetical protein